MFGRRKPIVELSTESELGGGLRRLLDVRHLVFLGIGAVVGAGIFSSIGDMAAGSEGRPGAGPSLVVSYVLTAIACGFAALCYAEIAAMVPIAGSAYTYAYVTLGEGVAWIIGWDLIIEYAIGNVYVAQSWTEYLRAFLLGTFGWDFPIWMATDMQTAANTPAIAAVAPHVGPWVVAFNLPAFVITALLTLALCRGVRESARINAGLVIGKLMLIVVFLAVGFVHIDTANYTPFAPGGWQGIWTAASIAFFSYIGFDAISTAAEEVRDPQRSLPRAMLIALAACAILYVAVALVMTGLVPSAQLRTGDPLAFALRSAGLDSLANAMAFGAVVAVTSVLLVFQMGQPRILLAMARDGLLPPAFARVHPRFGTPAFGTVMTGLFVAIAPSIMTPAQAIELTSIGTLFAFVLVSLAVLVLRIKEPDRHRPFRVPGYPVTPVLAMASCLFLMAGLPASNWWRFAVWLLVGGAIYGLYGRSRSRLGRIAGERNTKS
ncbi:MAG: amino acid permease [Deltaproteobacteria bacterium]|nr:amino acid permease [Deltaproteobacteria bacterium]